MSSENCAAHPVGYSSLLQKVMAILRTFFKNLNLLGQMFNTLQIFKKCSKRPYYLQRAAIPDQITQQNMQRAEGP